MFTVTGRTLLVDHLNATYNCCPDDILVELTVAGNYLLLTETEVLSSPAIATAATTWRPAWST